MIREVACKTALNKCNMPELDYSLNPYRGCVIDCKYCYSPFVLREKREWGKFVDVKINIAEVLAKELETKQKGMVWISSVTDPYQPIEVKYKLTQACLKELLKKDFPISIQTKSPLVLRDLDLIKQFSKRDAGFSFTTLDENDRKAWEPGSSPSQDKLKALKALAGAGIDTWVFLGPVIPSVTDKRLDEMIQAFSGASVGRVLVDSLHMKFGLESKLKLLFSDKYPQAFGANKGFYDKVESRIASLCEKQGIKCESAFPKP